MARGFRGSSWKNHKEVLVDDTYQSSLNNFTEPKKAKNEWMDKQSKRGSYNHALKV